MRRLCPAEMKSTMSEMNRDSACGRQRKGMHQHVLSRQSHFFVQMAWASSTDILIMGCLRRSGERYRSWSQLGMSLTWRCRMF